ncbi:hypothetical protein WJX84_000139 [Apatococcus fuscideae]|uniref:Cyclin C-terminal domain-containing protein n=1 Tax=Apatococcus fuscideae TaxID=2026836 RepID=A0AAW1T556_9CHLO
MFADERDLIWRKACEKRWPVWARVARAPDTQWKRQFELLELRQREQVVIPSIATIQRIQKVVTGRHREVLTEWLAEVSWDWNLESTIVFKAVSYLDHFLSNIGVKNLSRFQLLGIACLREAMGDTRRRLAIRLGEQDKNLDPARFAFISDRTYTVEEVEQATRTVADTVPEEIRDAPNGKMFLRSFWYRGVAALVMEPEEMHIYTIASFLLQLSLLDLECAGYPNSLLAASALSVALDSFGKHPWPSALQQYSAYVPDDIEPVRLKLKSLQASLKARHLRLIWRSHHENHGYSEFAEAWQRALQLLQEQSEISKFQPKCPSRHASI